MSKLRESIVEQKIDDHGIVKRKIISETLDLADRRRIKELISYEDQSNFNKTVRNIAKTLLNDGFKAEDIKDFLNSKIIDEIWFLE